MRIYPSLATSNLLKLEKTLSGLRDLVDGFHMDMMDGHFVRNYGLSPEIINAVSAYTPVPVWVHMMVEDPRLALKYLILRPGDIITFHVETVQEDQLRDLLGQVRAAGGVAGVALSPATAPESIYPLADMIDHITVMTVEPGFSGQPFLPSVVKKIQTLVAWAQQQPHRPVVGVDGGVNLATLPDLVAWGVTDVAVGSFVFFGDKSHEKIEQIRSLLA